MDEKANSENSVEIVERIDEGINTRIYANVDKEIIWEAGVRTHKGFDKMDPNMRDFKVNEVKFNKDKSNLIKIVPIEISQRTDKIDTNKMVDAKNCVDTNKKSDGDTNKSIDMSVDMKISEKSAMCADMKISEKSDMSADMKISKKSDIRLHNELEEGNENGDGNENLTNIRDGQVHPRDVEIRFEGIDFIKIST